MPNRYPVELRVRVVNAVNSGVTYDEAAGLFRVSKSIITVWKGLLRNTGSLEPKPTTNAGRNEKLGEHHEEVRRIVAETPDATLDELCEVMPVTVSRSSVDRTLNKLKLTRKKSRSMPPSKSGQTSKPSGSSGGRPRSRSTLPN